jgi:virginiamycin B lyase
MMRVSVGSAVCAAILMTILTAQTATAQVVKEYTVPRGDHPHDVAPAPDGSVWYTAQAGGALGRLDPITGRVSHVSLGPGSRPHGVIVGPDGAAWVTDSGLNAILRVDPPTRAIRRYPLPAGAAYADLNTAAFDSKGTLWFTGQAGYYGSVDPDSGRTRVFPAPRGRGPYGITASPDGYVYFVSLAGSYVGRIDPRTGEVTVLEPPWPGQGTRRIWADSRGILWITGWNAGTLLRLDPSTKDWKQYALPGKSPLPYALYVDESDRVWISDFAANALLLYEPRTGSFTSFPIASQESEIRQVLGRKGELWGAESGTDHLVVIRD